MSLERTFGMEELAMTAGSLSADYTRNSSANTQPHERTGGAGETAQWLRVLAAHIARPACFPAPMCPDRRIMGLVGFQPHGKTHRR